ncbi:MAG: LamG-like jellyroll fold domain-containing protein [Phycisphaerae bacterium]
MFTHIKRGWRRAAVATLAAATGVATVEATTQIINLQSGNGAVNTPDSQLRYWAAPGCCAQLSAVPFTAADFAAAQGGPSATVVTAHPNWIQQLPECPTSQWVGIDMFRTPRSALYAIPFTITSKCPSNVTMQICFAADDTLGDGTSGPNPDGLYINGVPLVGSGGSGINTQVCQFFNITALVSPGQNWLYLYDWDSFGVVSGINFCATIFADEPNGFISGVKYNDLDCDGTRDAGEPGLPGWTIIATNTVTGQTFSVTTGIGGVYNFTNLPLGNYTITEVQQPGWTRSQPECRQYIRSLNCQVRDIVGLNFGNCRCDGGQLTNLSTGIIDFSGLPLPVGTPDDTWRLVCRPSSVAPGGPIVVPTPGYWGSQAGAQWLSATPNGHLFTLPPGDYCYEACFEWCGCRNILLTLSVIADDTADIFLNGSYIGTHTNLLAPTSYNITSPALFCSGTNCIQVVARNTPQQLTPSGINVRAFVETGEGSCCANCPCYRPPVGMAGWWRFEESAASPWAYDLAGAPNTGSYTNGPVVAVGEVGQARRFDGVNDYVNVPNHPHFNPGVGRFSIDAWIRTAQTTGVQTIVEKVNYTFGAPPFQILDPFGYQLYVVNGQLGASLLSGAFNFENFLYGGPILADGCWHHVALTVIRNSPGGVKLFVDGNPQTFSTTMSGSVSNGAPLRIGATTQNTNFFNGLIDEVEFFGRALTPVQVEAIYGAASKGKCRQLCYVQPTTAFCSGATVVDVPFTICNNGSTSQSFAWTFSTLTSGGPCTISSAGSTFTNIPAGNTALIPPGGCVNRVVRITRPTAMTFNGAIACWKLNVINTSTNQTFACVGQLHDTRNACAVICPDCATPISEVFANTAVAMPIRISHGGGGAGGLAEFRIRAAYTEDSDDDGFGDPNSPIAGISLNRLPPGEPIIFGGGADGLPIDVDLEVALLDDAEAFAGYSIVVEGDLDGDGVWEPLGSRMISVRHNLPGDINGDCDVSLTDLSILLANFGAVDASIDEGDITGDGVVDLADLAKLLANFGESCP